MKFTHIGQKPDKFPLVMPLWIPQKTAKYTPDCATIFGDLVGGLGNRWNAVIYS